MGLTTLLLRSKSHYARWLKYGSMAPILIVVSSVNVSKLKPPKLTTLLLRPTSEGVRKVLV